MKRGGRPRRDLLIAMCPREPGWIVVDVGADHGHVAHALGAIATERAPNRIGRPDLRWIVADGLAPFRRVDVAVVAGMGAFTIAGILDRGPRPERAAVVHAPDDPAALRTWLAANGWRIDAEALAPEGGRFAEVIRAVPGREEATGLALALGPRLIEGGDPHLPAHLRALRDRFEHLARETADSAPDRHAEFARRAAFVAEVLRRRGYSL